MVRQYVHIPDETRKQLLQFINEGMTIKDAAARLKLNYENAKAIN
jgi:molybdenum-dependent DNA-binding transcriptional regulator ModE